MTVYIDENDPIGSRIAFLIRTNAKRLEWGVKPAPPELEKIGRELVECYAMKPKQEAAK